MITMKAAFLAVLFSTSIACMGYEIPIAGEGYSGPTNPQPGQDAAVAIIGAAMGSELGTETPILWHFNDDCADSTGNWGPKYGTPAAFMLPRGGGCVFGYYQPSGFYEASTFEAPNRIDIEWHGSFSAAQTLAHELCHAFKMATTGDADGNHTSDCFAMPGEAFNETTQAAGKGSMVDIANAALIAAGM